MSESVLVVTVTHNSGESLDAFLESLSQACETRHVSVVIVDNASADVNAVRTSAARLGATLIQSAENLGYGGGITLGVNSSPLDSQYILISNPDVTFRPGAIDVLIQAADRLATAGSLGPQILDATGNVYPSARNLPSLSTGVGHAVLGRLWTSNPWSRRYRADENHPNLQRDAGWLSGACLLVRRSAYDSVGGFDSSYFMYFEDVDLGARLAQAGWRNVYVPSSVVTHTGAHSTAHSATQMERVHHKSAYLYLTRKYSSWYLSPIRLGARVALAARQWWVTR
ncbi:glycosyltransferase family 2 protein [Cryobacterium glaciale]|uniref:Glycosyltransferase family 2 protein n=1 Tax=Cryobacterium glaciale TaxID=1259145 RepID=A0A4R8UXV3_9MICO|nr:glycosyltransferase family 2 protein [Cryobacterium glaciale]